MVRGNHPVSWCEGGEVVVVGSVVVGSVVMGSVVIGSGEGVIREGFLVGRVSCWVGSKVSW